MKILELSRLPGVGVVLLVSAVVLSACVSDSDSVGSSTTSRPDPSTTVVATTATTAQPAPTTTNAPDDAGIPTEVAENADGWPLPNRDYSATRATFDSAIDSTTVDRLEVAWTYDLGVGAPTNPIVIGDTVFIADQGRSVHAIDLDSGERKWIADGGGGVIGGPNGVAVGWGRVFSNDGGNAITAYHADTGRELWSTDILANGGAVNIQPIAADGMVLAATSSHRGLPGGRGTLYALDPTSGEILWSFDTIESDDLWGHPEINSGGGAWYPPAIHRGTTYWGTSNPAPYPGTTGFPNGSSRPGDNRWTNSLLAIGLDTGVLTWGHQVVTHDIFDYDSVIVAIAETDGGRVIVNTGKHGRILGFTGEGTLLWDTAVGMHDNDRLEAFEGQLQVLPGQFGGVITPIAIADGIIYAAVVNAPTQYARPDQADENMALGTFDSQMVAVDAATGQILWDVILDGDAFGAATVINDVVLTSLLDGRILALDRTDGRLIWEYQASGGINGWPAVVGDYLLVPVGLGDSPHLLALKTSSS